MSNSDRAEIAARKIWRAFCNDKEAAQTIRDIQGIITRQFSPIIKERDRAVEACEEIQKVKVDSKKVSWLGYYYAFLECQAIARKAAGNE